jgi:hypothetical protein
MRRILLLLAAGLAGSLACGCAGKQAPGPQAKSQSGVLQGQDSSSSMAGEDEQPAWQHDGSVRFRAAPGPAAENAMVVQGPPAAPPAGGAQAGPAKGAAQPVQRKIIYNATVVLIVEDLTRGEQAVRQIVQEHKGYIAQHEVLGSTGQPRQGHWRLRVPADRLQDVLAALVQLGVPQKNSTDSRDVTEEYYDLEARLKNKKVEETRLQGYLEDKKATSKLEDILAIERELNRVRGEIEQAEGRLRLLGNLATLATIDVTLHEVKDYVPPQAPTFAGQVGSTFSGSLDALTEFGKVLTLAGVALVPWLPLLAVVLVVVWLAVRRLRAPRPAMVLPVEPTPPAG